MREQLPLTRSGSLLRASHVNILSRHASRLAKFKGGNRQATHHSDSIISSSDPPGWIQSIVQITNDDDTDNGLYKVKLRYWNRNSEVWALIDKEWDLDAGDLDITLVNDDKVVAYWDVLRRMYIPTTGGSEIGLSTAIEFTLTQALTTVMDKAAAEVDVYYDGSDPGRYLNVWNKEVSEDYMFEGGIGAKGMAYYNKRLERYIIWNLQC